MSSSPESIQPQRPPETIQPPDFEYVKENSIDKLKRKSKDSPMMVLGLTGCAFVVAFGIYKYKYRGNLSTSNYLMQLRVTAQAAVIGCLTLGVCKSLYDHIRNKKGSDVS